MIYIYGTGGRAKLIREILFRLKIKEHGYYTHWWLGVLKYKIFVKNLIFKKTSFLSE